MSNTRWRATALAAVGFALLAACGVSSTTKAAAPNFPTPSTSVQFGAPADAATATRTVVVHARDDLTYLPATIAVKVGETITFQVINDGKAQHDFVLGDAQVQDDHQAAMAGMQPGSQMLMPDATNAVHIPPGQTKSITWTFPTAGMTLYASHEPGDYAGGMKGTITVS